MSAKDEPNAVTKLLSKAAEMIQSLFKQKEPLKNKEYDVYTRISCNKCSVKEMRSFQVGDYLFKDMGACQGCNGEMTITGIFTKTKAV
jgi:hypothetical protein